jgi:N-acetylglucosamine-6-sulfatase
MQSRAADSRPNIVFIITDDQRWDTLGCTGHPTLKTPNIDRIASEGMLFNNFFVCTPLCSPSRASFLTGLYPHRHKVVNNDKLGLDIISHTLVTFPRQLREAGYETAFIGKWHMGLDDSRRPGFDSWISFKGQGVYIDGVVNDNGMRRQMDGYMTDSLNEWAVDFVKKPHTKPFCLYLGHKAVHNPYLPAPRHDTLYADYEFAQPLKNKSDIDCKPVMHRDVPKMNPLELEGVGPEPGEPRRNRGGKPAEVVRDQLRCLASVDEGVGQLLEALESMGQLDNTVFIYTSDNGYLMGEHGQTNSKRWPYEEALRVPLLIRYPKLIAPGSQRDGMVLNIDIAPTLLELAGVNSIVPLQGQSFVPLLLDAHAPWRKDFLAEYFLEKVAPKVPDWQAVRTDRWKYIHYLESDSLDELYDLKADPHELQNLAGEAERRDTLEMLRSRLQDLLKETK